MKKIVKKILAYITAVALISGFSIKSNTFLPTLINEIPVSATASSGYNNTFSLTLLKDNVLEPESDILIPVNYVGYEAVQKIIFIFDADYSTSEEGSSYDNLTLHLGTSELNFTVTSTAGSSSMAIAEVSIPIGTDLSNFQNISLSRETSNAASLKLSELNLILPNRYAFDSYGTDPSDPNCNIYIDEPLKKGNQILADVTSCKNRGTLQSIRINFNVVYNSEQEYAYEDIKDDIYLGYYVNGEYTVSPVDLEKQTSDFSVNIPLYDVGSKFTFSNIMVGYSSGNAETVTIKSIDVVFDPNTLKDAPTGSDTTSPADTNPEASTDKIDISQYTNTEILTLNQSLPVKKNTNIDISSYADRGGIKKIILDYSLDYTTPTDNYAQDGGELVYVTNSGWSQLSYIISGTIGEKKGTMVELSLEGAQLNYEKSLTLTHSWGTSQNAVLNSVILIFNDDSSVETEATTVAQ